MLADLARDLFLAGTGTDADDIAHHDALDGLVRRRQDQLAQGQRPQQVALPVEHVGLVDGFGIRRFPAQHVDGLAGGKAGVEA
ncbi:hypothetical protein D3C76_1323390 [compost metagenome]